MTTFMSPLAFLTFLTLLVHGLATSLLHVRQPDDSTAPFYKALSSKVDSIAAAVDFDSQEQKRASQTDHSPVASADHGAAVLKNWVTAHNSPRAVVNVSELGAELGGYALHLRDRNRQSVAAEVHDMMHKAASATSAVGEPLQNANNEPGSNSGQALADAGRDLMRRWSKSHEVPSPARIEAKLSSPQAVHKIADTMQQHKSKKASADVGHAPMKPTPSKSFSHAHTMMREFESEYAAGDDGNMQTAPTSGEVASGGDLLANWAKTHGEDVTKASVHQELMSAAVTVTSSPRSAQPEPEPQPAAISIHEDLQSLKSTMRNMQSDDSRKESQGAQLHNAMHSIGNDVSGPVSLDSDVPSVSDTMKAAGVHELEEWSKARSKAQVSRFMSPRPKLEKQESPAIVPPPTAKHATVAEMPVDGSVAKLQKWHASALHDAMRSIGDGALDLASAQADDNEHADTRKAGADALEQWAKAHQPKQMPIFMKREALLSPSSSPAMPAPIETRDHNEEPRDSEKMQLSVKTWQGSSLHSAMRDIGSDVPDIDMSSPGASTAAGPAMKNLEAAGVDALDHWSKAHDKAARHSFMYPTSNAVETPAQPRVVPHDEQAIAQHPRSDDVVNMRAAMSSWHGSALHDAMHSIVSDVPDTMEQPVDANPQMRLEGLKAAGADALAKWTKAHEKPRVPKFIMPVQALPSSLPDEHEANTQPASVSVEDLRTSELKMRQSALHDAMRNIGSDAPDSDVTDAHPPQDALKAVGADTLERWSKAHAKSQLPKFVAPVEDIGTITAAPLQDQTVAVLKPPEELHTSLKQLHESAAHEAMRSIVDDVPKEDADAEVQAQPAKESVQTSEPVADDNGKGLVEDWTTAHSETHKKSNFVNMYPPTPAPETDMVALAMARGFGKKAAASLEAPVSKAGQLHKAMQSITQSTESVSEEKSLSEDPPSGAAASAGADLLKKWSRSHRASFA